jgi:hypothetical protein
VLTPEEELLPHPTQRVLGAGELSEPCQEPAFSVSQLEERDGIGGKSLPQAATQEQPARFSELSAVDENIEKALPSDGEKMGIALEIEQGKGFAEKAESF